MPNNPPSATQNHRDDDISIAKLLKILLSQWQWPLGGAFTGLILALSIIAAIPARYEASVLMQIGRLTSPVLGSALGSGSGSGSGSITVSEVEPTLHLIERLNSTSFKSRLQGVAEINFSINATAIKNTKLVRISVNASSPNLASEILARVIDLITADHRVVTEALEKRLLLALQSNRDQLRTASDLVDQINRTLTPLSLAKQDPITAFVLTQTQQHLRNHQLSLNNWILHIETSLTEQQLFNSKPIEAIDVDTDPVFPKTQRLALLALLAGGFVGALVAFFRANFKKFA
jgi:uncharacterized protein involved in exopolysaccharide biosynthesis